MTTTYPISVFQPNIETNIFIGVIIVNDATNLVTGVFETINDITDYETNLLIPTGTGTNEGLGSDGFTYYRIEDFFEVGGGGTVSYDNIYVKGWNQFDTKGLIFSGMSYYPYYTNINLFAASSGDQTVNRIATILAKNTNPADELAVDNTKVSLDVEVFITQPPTPTPISNICFLGNTPIKTDQGKIFIENIDANIHTIRNKKIVAITKTVTNEKHLVCFEKHSLGTNYPNQKTVMSKNHKVKYNGQMIPAYKFVDKFQNVNKIKYNGEILYNVLMENYDLVKVNNMVCETLHPENIIAKLYNSKLSRDVKNQLIVKMNNQYLKNKKQIVMSK